MAKQGKIKNGNNKAKHTKLLNQKKNKIKAAKLQNKQRLKAIMDKKNRMEGSCPCGSGITYAVCCNIFHTDIMNVKTAEQLMRSRYTAYVFTDIDYLMKSHHSSTRPVHEKKEILEWARAVKWERLVVDQVLKGEANDADGIVAFTAYFKENGLQKSMHETSKFIKENNHWVYLGEA